MKLVWFTSTSLVVLPDPQQQVAAQHPGAAADVTTWLCHLRVPGGARTGRWQLQGQPCLHSTVWGVKWPLQPHFSHFFVSAPRAGAPTAAKYVSRYRVLSVWFFLSTLFLF